MDLKQLKCKACEGWMKPFTQSEIKEYLPNVQAWSVVEDKKIEKDFKFKNFKEALGFVNKVGIIAEQEQHHPNIFMHRWNKVKVTLTTFTLKGLSRNDFIMAAKIDSI